MMTICDGVDATTIDRKQARRVGDAAYYGVDLIARVFYLASASSPNLGGLQCSLLQGLLQHGSKQLRDSS